jgi:hypothetical protein
MKSNESSTISTEKFNTQLAASKTEPQKDTSKRLLILSRVKDEEFRRQLEINDSWTAGLTFTGDEEVKAKQELAWLQSKNIIREYMLVAIIDRYGDLDDEIPF